MHSIPSNALATTNLCNGIPDYISLFALHHDNKLLLINLSHFVTKVSLSQISIVRHYIVVMVHIVFYLAITSKNCVV
jgi:hypothetical protein